MLLALSFVNISLVSGSVDIIITIIIAHIVVTIGKIVNISLVSGSVLLPALSAAFSSSVLVSGLESITAITIIIIVVTVCKIIAIVNILVCASSGVERPRHPLPSWLHCSIHQTTTHLANLVSQFDGNNPVLSASHLPIVQCVCAWVVLSLCVLIFN